MSARVGFFTHPVLLEHDTGPAHPESSERLLSILSGLETDSLGRRLIRIEDFPHHAPECLASVHTEAYIDFVRRAFGEGEHALDLGDTVIGEKSWEAALRAVDASVEAALQVWRGELDRAFAAVRPPGHHAECGRAMGFCIFNNIAVAASAVLAAGAERLAIIDWDVHHGNGTQHCFQHDGRVLFFSLHQYPFYPGSGSGLERGEGAGSGLIHNLPMLAGCGEEEYLVAFESEVLPALERQRPQMMFVSAGFDGHKDDPLAQMKLETGSYAAMTRILLDAAREYCGGKLVSILEGGYNLKALRDSVMAHLREMAYHS